MLAHCPVGLAQRSTSSVPESTRMDHTLSSHSLPCLCLSSSAAALLTPQPLESLSSFRYDTAGQPWYLQVQDGCFPLLFIFAVLLKPLHCFLYQIFPVMLPGVDILTRPVTNSESLQSPNHAEGGEHGCRVREISVVWSAFKDSTGRYSLP